MKNYFCFILIIISFTTMYSQEWIKVGENLNFPEGPAWDGEKSLYVSSCYGGFISIINSNGQTKFIDSTQQPFKLKQTNGLTFYKDGFLYACDYGIGAILKISKDGNSEIFIPGYNGVKFNRPNDLAFDNKGNLYFTDPKSYDKNNLDGKVFKVNIKTKEVTIAESGIGFANGIVFNEDFSKVFVCESALQRILVYDVDDKGDFSNKKVFAELPGGDPDGLAIDKEGNLYAAHFGGGNIVIFDPQGNVIKKIQTPGKKPSNVEFGENDLKTLFITEDETNCVYKMKVDVAGLNLLR
ncbi:MAG: SMP-30/gluconolactonase/LRE family protein [Syntrophothermus sp.]